jgi:hypothetical protein
MTGLIGWWPLHENSGSTARDLSGNGNHGSLNGGVTQGVAGKGGLTAYSFDGNDDYVTLGDTVIPTGQYSIGLWVKPQEAKRNGLVKQNNDYLEFTDSGDNFYMWTDSGINLSSESLPYDRWHHCVISVGDTTTEMYVNGAHQATSETSGNFRSGTTQIGSWPGNLNGCMADFRLYNRALNPSEIQTLYEWGSGDYASPPTDGTAYYPLDGNTNDSWESNNGTNNGVTFVDGVRGQAGKFVASENDYISIPHNSSLAPDKVTVSAWAIADEWANRHNIVNKYGDSSTGIDGYDGPYALRAIDGNLQFGISPHGDGTNYFATTPVPEQTGLWYHLVGTYDGSEIKLYINSNLEASTSYSTSNLADYTTSLEIGRSEGAGRYWDGLIDDVRIYNRALEPYEVFQLYQWGTKGRDMRKLTTNARGDQ